jgi:hypothetical protein
LESAAPGPELRLLVTALMLQRAPAVVRSHAFAAAIRAWRADRSVPAIVRSHPAEAVRIWRGDVERTEAPADLCAGELRTDELRSSQPTAPEPRQRKAALAASRAAGQARHIVTRSPEIKPVIAVASAGSSASIPSEAAVERITTEYGGVFYLVNVALDLALYGDFTTPAQPGLALPIWDFLTLIGERMAGPTLAEDPLGALLARLSRRAENEPAGKWFEPPGGQSLSEWIERTFEQVQARLVVALGIADSEALYPLVLEHRADIEATATRIDVRFSLSAHPIELRIAGLDRDPGWVPSGGRSIAFHYE